MWRCSSVQNDLLLSLADLLSLLFGLVSHGSPEILEMFLSSSVQNDLLLSFTDFLTALLLVNLLRVLQKRQLQLWAPAA